MNVINQCGSLESYRLLMPVKVQRLGSELLIFYALSLYGETAICVFQGDIIDELLLLNKDIPLDLNEFKKKQCVEVAHSRRVCQLCNIHTKIYDDGNKQQLTMDDVIAMIAKLDKRINRADAKLTDIRDINNTIKRELLNRIHGMDVIVYYAHSFAIGHIINHYLNIPDDYVAMCCTLVDKVTGCNMPLYEGGEPTALMECPKYFLEYVLHEALSNNWSKNNE